MVAPSHYRWLVVALWVAVVVAEIEAADWTSQCPDACKCTYVSNRKSASCFRSGYHTIPSLLSPEVQELNLNENSIAILEKQVFKQVDLLNLKVLKLAKNRISKISQDAFDDLSVIFDINLSQNKIEKLHPRTFSNLGKLVNLDLSGNQLTRLSAHQFPSLPFLRNLHLRNNRLDYVNSYAFENLPILMTVSLSDNNLEVLEPEVFMNKTQLKSVELFGNNWVCDCRLKRFIRWIKSQRKVDPKLTCAMPKRLTGQKWEKLDDSEIACIPQLTLETDKITVKIGHNASLFCSATGDPLPEIQWLYKRQRINNYTRVWYSNPERFYHVSKTIQNSQVMSTLLIKDLTEEDVDSYTCVAENSAGFVSRNISLTLKSVLSPNVQENATLYIIIAAVISSVLFIILVILCCYLCWRKNRQHQKNTKSLLKQNGSLSHQMEQNNILIVNPVEKPPRQYEKVPQTDVELNTMSEAAGHHSFDSVDYQESLMAHHYHNRGPLATLEEECDDPGTQNTTLESSLPYHHSLDHSHVPDLLDNARLPRAVSPTQLSYHSLGYPSQPNPNNVDWRYSYILPGEHSRHYPGYNTPQQNMRPGYVTLPRRPRVPSWAGSPGIPEGEVVKKQTLYDKLGPRTTADGTSKTDLTKPSRSSIVSDPYSLITPTSPVSPEVHNMLPTHYTPINEYKPQPLSHCATLPRSNPNLLESRNFSVMSKPSPIHKTSITGPPPPLASSPTPSSSSTVRLVSPGQPSPSSAATSDSATIDDHPAPSVSPSYYDSNTTKNNNTSINNKNIDDRAPSISSYDPPMSTKKKVPPKPPPKPSIAKRLSLSSPSSESSTVKFSSDGGRIYQDEGPDGTEV